MKPTLVILAAGLGSRYGGIKQLDGFGPSGERIIDYTIYDALKSGFGKIVFVIRKQIEQDFSEAILTKWEARGDFRVVYQELDSLPEGYSVPDGRTKPWGTAHAVWMAEKEVNEPFAIVNADDFYGYQSLKTICDHLATNVGSDPAGCMVGYQLVKTLTEFGTVSRGVCHTDESGNLIDITERTKIGRDADGIYYEEEDHKTQLEPETVVSMNLMGFSGAVFQDIAKGFDETYQQTSRNVNVEYYIPKVLNGLVERGIKVPVLPTSDNWFGVTYTEDKPWVKAQLKRLVEQGRYPENLFE